MKTRGLCMLSIFAALSSACDPGYVEVVFTWAGGRPTFPEEANVTKTMLIQERTDPKIPGRDLVPPQTLPFSQSFSEIEEVPYGKSCVAIGEVQLGKEVLYYGISNVFTVERGENIKVSVYLEPTQPPQPLPPELGASLVIVTSTSASGYVNRPEVELLITAPLSAEKVRLSNVVGLPENKSELVALSTLETIDGAPEGYRRFRLGSWNLERDVEEECRDKNRCRREVFAAFLDAQQYAGPPVLASVILDQVAPSLLVELTSVSPEAARDDSLIIVNLTANEVVREPVLALAQRVELPFVRVSPSDDAPTASYTFTSSQTAGSIGRNDEFLIRATLRDLAGNVARDVEVGRLRVDTVLPAISEVAVSPARINGEVGGVVTASFTLNKRARYTVMITGRPMDTCVEAGRPPELRVTCTRAMRGDEIPDGEESSETLSIDAEDDAQNTARRVNVPLTLDFKDPLLFAATFTPESSGNELVQLALITDEPLEEGFVPELLWAGLPAPFVHDPARDRPYERYFVLTPPIDIPRGEYVLSGVTLRDEALNEAISTSSTALPRSWLFDPDVPSIENLVVTVQGSAPVVPPRIPAIAGSVIEIDFAVREEHPAFVRVLLGTRDITSLCTSSGVSPASWNCAYVTSGAEFPLGVEQGESVLVEAGDESGGRSSITAPIIWDYAPPSLQSVSISPAAAGIGTSAQLTLAVSEELAPGFEPPLTFSPPVAFVFDVVRSTAFQPVYQYSVPLSPAMPSSTFVLNEVRLRDVAGNEAVVNGSLATLLVDNVAPQITGLTVLALSAPYPATPPRINALPGQQIEVRFAVTEVSPATAVPSVLLGATDISANCVSSGSAPSLNWTCRYSTTGAEISANTEQTAAVVVELLDLSGNRESETTSVVFDYLPPSIQSVAVDPAATGLGRSALLTLAASEPLAPGFDPVLFWSPAISFFYETARSTQFQHVFRYDVTAADVPRRYVLERARLLDLAGNEATVQITPPLNWLLDNVAPVISAVEVDVDALALNLPETTPPRINGAAGRRVRVRFTVTEENAGPSPQVMIGAVDASASCTSAGASPVLTWTCLYHMTGNETPGLQIIALRAADAAENVATDASAAVVFDFDPPQLVVGSESLQLFPATSNLLTQVPGPRIELGAWGLGTTAFVGFVFDEPLARAPQVSAMPSALAFQLSQESGSAFTFEHEMIAAPRQGAHRIEVNATDVAGNAVVRTLATQVQIDSLPPAAPNTLRLTHTRVPWGSDATGDGEHALLAGDAGAVEANARVVVLGGESLATFQVLGTALSDSTGALPSFELDRREDRAEIFVVVLDGAGNSSPSVAGDATRASRVRRGEWIASLRGKVPGRRAPNPHDAEMYTGLLPTLAQNTDQTIELNAADFARMAATDGQTLRVETVRRFEPILSVPDQPSPRERAAMAYDSMRGRAVLFGGRSPETLGDTWEWDGRRWFSVVGTSIPPPIRSGASMAFDAARGVVLVFGGVDPLGTVLSDTWAWDGEAWTELTGATSPPPRQLAAMAYDPENARVVLYGGTGSTGALRDTWIWNGQGWAAETCTFGCPAARTEASMVWNGGARLLLMGGVGAAPGNVLDSTVWAHEAS